ncbi:coat protein [Loquat associated totivirus 1]|nr:coat protein [Loquat associated totivirus 1]
MDSFVKRFFPNHEAPGAEFNFDGNLRHSTYHGGVLRVNDSNITTTRNYFSVQKMTAVGKFQASLQGSSSSLDGLSKQFLTPEGTVNITNLADALKQTAGLQTHVWSTHVNAMQRWSWSDNHVSLLVNMLRFCMLMKMQESNEGSLKGELGTYSDGHVSIDMDQWWPERYEEEASFDSWPGGAGEENYPDYQHLTTTTPALEHPAVDLRGLNVMEATIVLMLTARWSRRSRARLDFDSPKLTELLYYRHGSKLTGVDAWLKGEEGARAPDLPNSAQIWSALRAYVGQNRLYDQFSAALYIIGFAAYQFVPSTAEACVWLQMDWKVVYPQFTSIRGRYDVLNDGEAALVSHRAINEWGYINGRLEKVNLICLLIAQCFQTGCAVRSNRMGLEVDPHDLYSTQGDFYSASNFASAAVSEAIRAEFPMPGMSGIYLDGGVRFDDPHDFKIITMNDNTVELVGYDTEVVEITSTSKQMVRVPISEYVGTEQHAEMVKKLKYHKEIISVKEKYERPVRLNGDEMAAREDAILEEQEIEEGEEKLAVRLTWIPFAGVPTLAMPLNPFPYASPFNLKGVIDPGMGELTRKGFKMKAKDAWVVANLARLCGYDIDFRTGAELAGPTAFFSPNDVNMVWPVLNAPEEQDEDMTITSTTERSRVFIQLPPLHNKFFANQKLEYSVQIQRKGVCLWYDVDRKDISEFGGRVRITKDITVTVNTDETVQRMRGYITREEQGFRFVTGVQAGVIPQPNLEQGAPPVEGM